MQLSEDNILKHFSYFSQNTGFEIWCKLPPVFWAKQKNIINLSSAELAQSVVKV